MNTLGTADTNPALRQVKVHTADGEWFAWLRTRTPLLGARKDNLIRLRPGGRWLRRIATASVLCALFEPGFQALLAGEKADQGGFAFGGAGR